ncbi:MAG: phosphoglucosamine mutase [Pseudomonadales bacterium]
MSRRYFGTDGIRGRVGDHPITPEFCLRLGWAVGRVFAAKNTVDREPRVLIGKDTRISGYMLESVLESGLVSAGVSVGLMGPMPTPAIAYLTRTLGADAGIVISASHNPYFDNGIKFFDASGNKLADIVEMEIEKQLDAEMVCVDSNKLGKATRIEDAAGRYIEFCKASVNRGLRLTGMNIVVDCAHGATYHVAPRVFEELGAEVTLIGVEPDGFNINERCGSTAPEALAARVIELGADLGVAFDGDGDRVIMVDESGAQVDGDELIYLIAMSRARSGVLDGGVVGTVMSNYGLEQALAHAGIDFVRAKVGDRYVLESMRERGWQLGGESSGHIICLDLTTTGDAIVAALQVLSAMVESGATLGTLKCGMHKLPQTLLNVPVAQPSERAAATEVTCAIGEMSAQLAGRGRVLVRPSGTEPVVRVMVEGDSATEVAAIADELAQIVADPSS